MSNIVKEKKKTDDREIELDTTTQKVDINDSVDESEIDENLAGDINYKFEEMENEEDIENENKEDNGDESQKGHLKQVYKIMTSNCFTYFYFCKNHWY